MKKIGVFTNGGVYRTIKFTPLKYTWTKKKPIDKTLLHIAKILAL